MVDILREGHSETQDARTRPAGTGAGDAEGRSAPHPGRVRPSSSWLPELLGPGKAQNAGATDLRFCGIPENWNARNAGPTPYRAAGSLSSVDGESTHP